MAAVDFNIHPEPAAESGIGSTSATSFYRCDSEGAELFAVRSGVPPKEALSCASDLLASAIDILGDKAEFHGDDGLFGVMRLVEMAKGIVDASGDRSSSGDIASVSVARKDGAARACAFIGAIWDNRSAGRFAPDLDQVLRGNESLPVSLNSCLEGLVGEEREGFLLVLTWWMTIAIEDGALPADQLMAETEEPQYAKEARHD